MIVIRLSSGLGNQLFMYAFYKYIELKYGEMPYFDDKYFVDRRGIIRQSELAVLFPNYPVCKFHFNPAGERRFRGYFFRWKQKLFPSFRYINEKDYDDTFDYKGDIYFNGFWQNHKYVDQLDKSLFVSKEPFPSLLENVRQQIENSACPVCIHFRRGDYFMPKWIHRYGVCTLEYYKRAMNLIESKVNEEIVYFVFSDDLNWVKQNISFNSRYILVPNYDINSYWYIYLMSICHHNIISNSTFSWWGAYLNNNATKYVVAPEKWMFDTDTNIALDEWIKVKVD